MKAFAKGSFDSTAPPMGLPRFPISHLASKAASALPMNMSTGPPGIGPA